MSMKLVLIAVLLALPLRAAEKPNLVIIFTDDQRHDAVGYTGNNAVHTPNLDRLAKRGLVFTNAFVNTSICAISRANLMMGQYPHRHGVDDFFKTLSDGQLARSVPARLRDSGYQTAFFGKWGIGDSAAKTALGATVFDYWAGQPKQTNFFHDTDCRYIDPEPNFEQLFDLETDPDQLNNLVAKSAHAPLLKKLRARCDELHESTGPLPQQ